MSILLRDYGGGREPTFWGWSVLIVAVIAVVATVFVLVTGVRLNKVGANEWGCLYGGGLFDSRGLKASIAPGNQRPAMFDRLATLASDDRFYVVDSDPKTADLGGTPIQVPTKPLENNAVGPRVEVAIQARFKLNENVCDLYTRHLRRQEPLNMNAAQGEESGWANFLNLTFNQVMAEATRDIVRQYDWVALYSNASVNGQTTWNAIEEAVSKALSEGQLRTLGGTFFNGPSYSFDGDFDGVLQSSPSIEVTVKGVAPINQALVQNQEAIQENAEAQRKISSDQDRELADIARQEAVAVREAARQQEVQVAQQKAEQAIQRERAATERARQVAEQEAAVSRASYCERLTQLGQRCDLVIAAENRNYPQVVGADSVIVAP
jgi:hypothetical protein